MSDTTEQTIDIPRLSVAVSRFASTQDERDPSGWAGGILAEVLEAAPGVKEDISRHLALEEGLDGEVGDFQIDATSIRAALDGVDEDRAELFMEALSVAAHAEIDEGFDWADFDRLASEAARLEAARLDVSEDVSVSSPGMRL